jgi:hypothetical protein
MMWRFFVDESLPNLAVQRLREEGYVVESVRELNMQGATDEAVFAEAQKRQAILVTGDEDFADITRFPNRNTSRHHCRSFARDERAKGRSPIGSPKAASRATFEGRFSHR